MRLVSKLLVPALIGMCVAMPNSLFASSSTVDLANLGGTLSATTTGMTLSGSTLIAVSGFGGNGLVTGDLGTVSFTTGALVNGSLQMGGTFNDGTFTVTTNGFGQLGNGVLFSGSFNGPVTWTLITNANGTHNYLLSGVLTGSINGVNVDGVSVQLTINTGKGFFNGSATISSGDTSLSPAAVPEPPTLGLFGIGIFGLAAAVRRKALSQQAPAIDTTFKA